MPTRTVRSENGVDKKMPNVFERLSKQQTNKVNSQRNFRSLDQDPKKASKSTLSSTRRKSVPSNPNPHTQHKTRNKSIDYSGQHLTKEKITSSETYNQKALMEKVPETIGKDLYELIGKEQQLDSNDCKIEHDKNNINELSLSTLESNNIKNNVISEAKSEINYTPTVPYKNVIYKKSSSLTEQENRNSPSHNRIKILKKKLSLPDTLNETKKSTKFESGNVELKTRNIIDSSSELEVLEKSSDKVHKNTKTLKVPSNKKQPVIDDDKDICDADNEGEDGEFYKVKVQTRLVSYENSTLFIKNTSKQTIHDDISLSESETVGEPDSSLPESLSSCSLQSSSSGQESSGGTEDLVTTQPSEEGEQMTLKGVRSKIGQLMTKGRSILSDVRNSPYSYVPDVKTSFNKFQGVTRRSLQAITFPKNNLYIQNEERRTIRESKLELDSGFSSLNSVSNTVVNEIRPSVEPEPISASAQSYAKEETLPNTEHGHDLQDLQTSTESPDEAESSTQLGKDMAESSLVSQEDVENGESEFSKFFLACSCQGRTRETEHSHSESSLQHGDQRQQNHEEICSCQEESELPAEIVDLLDIDYARMWWTITGNFGNILPIDWSKTYTRQKYLPVLNLNEAAKKCALEGAMDSLVTPSPRGDDDDEEVAQDLDLHQLILAGTQQENEPVKSAEEVIKEIDDIMQEASSSEDEGIDASTDSKSSSKLELQQLPPPLYHDKLKDLNVNELNETLMELEVVIRRYSETLIAQLAHRDELEYEKELKNTFISLLLQVQNRRRNFNVEKKRVKKPLGTYGIDPKYLTTVIPYDVGHGPPDNETIQILIKILRAINEDTPTVPTLLTDYILKVLCPS